MSKKTKAEKHARRVRVRKGAHLRKGKARLNPLYLHPFVDDNPDARFVRGILHVFQGLEEMGIIDLSKIGSTPIPASDLATMQTPDKVQ